MSDVTAIRTEAIGPRSAASRVKRLPDRASYDDGTVYSILDAGMVGHVGFASPSRPLVIPMLYAREDDVIYLHGSVASRLQRTLARGIDTCLTVTLIDGLVLARSAFHHSMNYRSAVVFGRASAVAADEKEHALWVISEHLVPGRWAEVREPNRQELAVTAVLRMVIEEASAKIRRGGPVDDEEDLDLPIWAGVLPCSVSWAEPAGDEHVAASQAVSASVLARRRADR
jgi:hypothetical protein